MSISQLDLVLRNLQNFTADRTPVMEQDDELQAKPSEKKVLSEEEIVCIDSMAETDAGTENLAGKNKSYFPTYDHFKNRRENNGLLINTVCKQDENQLKRDLILYSEELNYSDPNGWNALMHAISNRRTAMIYHLLSANDYETFDTQLNQRCKQTGLTPLMIALDRMDFGTVMFILNNSKNPVRLLNQQDNLGRTPLIIASKMIPSVVGERTAVTFSRNERRYKMQIEAEVQVQKSIAEIIMTMVEMSTPEMLTKQDGSEQEGRGNSALFYAFINRKIRFMKALLTRHAAQQWEGLEKQLGQPVLNYLNSCVRNLSKPSTLWNGFSQEDRAKEIAALVDEYSNLEHYVISLLTPVQQSAEPMLEEEEPSKKESNTPSPVLFSGFGSTTPENVGAAQGDNLQLRNQNIKRKLESDLNSFSLNSSNSSNSQGVPMKAIVLQDSNALPANHTMTTRGKTKRSRPNDADAYGLSASSNALANQGAKNEPPFKKLRSGPGNKAKSI